MNNNVCKKPNTTSFSVIKDVIGVVAILFSVAVGIYEYGRKTEIEKENTENSIKQARHADSLAVLTYKNQIIIYDEVKSYNKKLSNQDSFQTNRILKLEKSVQELGKKILSKDDFYQFMQPYISSVAKNKDFYYLTLKPKESDYSSSN